MTLQDCTGLNLSVAQSALPPDTYEITVKNPGSAGCTSLPDLANPSANRTVIVPPPTVTSATTLPICALGNTTVQMTGTNFLLSNPSLVRSSRSAPRGFPATIDPASCSPVSLQDAPDAQLCTALSFTVQTGALAQGNYQATVRKPRPERLPDRHAAASQRRGCADAGSGIGGAGQSQPAIHLHRWRHGGGDRPEYLQRRPHDPLRRAVRELQRDADHDRGTADRHRSLGRADSRRCLDRSDGRKRPGVAACSATLSNVETVTPGPAVLFVDPPVVPSIISLQATVYAAGVSSQIKEIKGLSRGQHQRCLDLQLDEHSGAGPGSGVHQSGLHHAADRQSCRPAPHDLRLDDLSTCSAFLPNAFRVVTTPTLTVTSTTPAFGSTAQNTGVIVVAAVLSACRGPT